DVYSLGASLYALLTGKPPFQADTPVATLKQVLEQDPIPPRKLRPEIPRDLEVICLKCLEKEPAKRYQSAEELAGGLRLFLDGKPIPDRRATHAERIWRWCRRKPVMASMTGAISTLAFVLVVGGPIAIYLLNARRQRAESAEGNLRIEHASLETANG